MIASIRLRAIAAIAVLPMLGAAANPQDNYIAFVTCPVLRDTPELPCWMARKDGQLYYLGIQSGRSFGTEFFPPQQKHRMLVEGYVSPASEICGGQAIERSHVSVLPEIDLSCTEMLPTEGYVSPKGRPAGADPALPAGSDAPLRGPQDEPPILYTQDDIAARSPKRFYIDYNFDSDFTQYPLQQYKVIQAQEYAQAIGASRIEVMAFRGATLLSNGQTIVEDARIPAQRARNIQAILDAFDVPENMLSVYVREQPQLATGADDYKNRQVQIEVVP